MSAAGSSGSTSNDADDPNEHLDTLSPSGVNESDSMNLRSSPATNLEELSACHTASETASVCFLHATHACKLHTHTHTYSNSSSI